MPSDQLGPEVDARATVERAARLGPYFAWEPYDEAADWRPLAALFDADVVAERVAAGRRALIRMSELSSDDIGRREIASITFLGLASRLLSPVLAGATVGGALPLPDRDRMWWRPVAGGPVPIAYRGLTAAETAGRDVGAVARTLTRTAIRGLVEPLLEVFGRRFAVSHRVLWGNVSSALGGAAGMIADLEPDHAARAAAVVAHALAEAPLLGTATLARPDPEQARWFLVRNNCCLYYRIPGGGTCGDCVLTPPDERRRGWQAALRR